VEFNLNGLPNNEIHVSGFCGKDRGLFAKTQNTPIIMSWTEGQEVKPPNETTKGKGIDESTQCEDLIIRNEDKPMESATLDEDQEIHHSRTVDSKVHSKSIEDNQIASQDKVHQPGNHSDGPQAKRSRRPPSKRRDDFLW
jgi:hypothetical protein